MLQLSPKVVNTGFGFCIPDESGSFLQAKIGWIKSVMEAEEGEAFALLRVMQWIAN